MSEFEVNKIETEISPSKRQGFGLCNNNENVYIYGGWDGSNRLDDLWCLNGMNIYMYLLMV